MSILLKSLESAMQQALVEANMAERTKIVAAAKAGLHGQDKTDFQEFYIDLNELLAQNIRRDIGEFTPYRLGQQVREISTRIAVLSSAYREELIIAMQAQAAYVRSTAIDHPSRVSIHDKATFHVAY